MNFSNKYFKKNDEYYTSKDTWKLIKDIIPKDFILWESFFSKNSKSAEYLRQLGFEVISEDVDFYTYNLGNIIVSNPPFSDLQDNTQVLSCVLKENTQVKIILWYTASATVHASSQHPARNRCKWKKRKKGTAATRTRWSRWCGAGVCKWRGVWVGE